MAALLAGASYAPAAGSAATAGPTVAAVFSAANPGLVVVAHRGVTTPPRGTGSAPFRKIPSPR